ncbi:hypothetical protein LTS15_010363 [Exophiala xenobiotica]|nr:hypothetical protein LTS15_010363 [Exophiala xenobiotica]
MGRRSRLLDAYKRFKLTYDSKFADRAHEPQPHNAGPTTSTGHFKHSQPEKAAVPHDVNSSNANTSNHGANDTYADVSNNGTRGASNSGILKSGNSGLNTDRLNATGILGSHTSAFDGTGPPSQNIQTKVPAAHGIDLPNPHEVDSQHPVGRNSNPNDNVAESNNKNLQVTDFQTTTHRAPNHDTAIQAQKLDIPAGIDPPKSGDGDNEHAEVTPQVSARSAVTVSSMVSSRISPGLPSSTASPVISPTNEELAASTTGTSTHRSDQPPPVWKEFAGEDHELLPEKMSIAAEIDCRTVVHLDETRLPGSDEVVAISWLATGQYSKIKEEIVRRLENELKQRYRSLPRPKLHRQSAHVKLLEIKDGTEKRLEKEAVDHRDSWAQKVPIFVARHGSQTPFRTLLLEVDWHFDIVDIYGQDGDTLAEKVSNLVLEKRQRNWRDQWFLPRADLDAIFSEEIIEELINNDDRVSNLPLQPNTGKPLNRWTSRWIFLNAPGLFATCIWARISLACLHQLVVIHQKADVDRPWKEAPPGVAGLDFDALMSKQRTFWVYNFDAAKLKSNMEKGKYEVIENWQTVPIIAKGTLGEGGFGLVIEVSIHPNHHTFKEHTFALKQLHHTVHTAPIVSQAFARENNVFSKLMGTNHRNILVPLAMWRQKDPGAGDRFNMLFSKAKYNLKEHLRTFRVPPRREKDFVLDLFQQLRDLSDALDKIHLIRKHSGLTGGTQEQFQRPTTSRANSASLLVLPQSDKSRYGTVYHHDLKPENILIFEDGTWKISDFGTAKITEAVSGRSVAQMFEFQAGDEVYSPPDRAMGKSTARPYDVWCFGCILLEILLTLFHETTPGDFSDSEEVHRLDAFYLERAESIKGVGSVAYFWYHKLNKDGTDEFELREPVKERFRMLKRQTEEYDQFDALVVLAEEMMAIEPSRRPSAERVLARMREIHENVTHNLNLNEAFYITPGTIAERWASRPTTEAGGSQSSRQRYTHHLPSERAPAQSPKHLSPTEVSKTRRHSAPGSNSILNRLDIAGGPSFDASSEFQTAVEETPSSPAVRVHYADAYADTISLGSTDGAAASGEENPIETAAMETTSDG